MALLDKFSSTVMKANNDPIYFIYEVLDLPELFPKQEQIIRDFYSFKYNKTKPMYNELILCAGMRSISEDSLILTFGGVKKAKDVTLDNYLWDGCEWNKPIKKFDHYEKDSLKIKTQYGLTLKCSKEHRVWTQDGFKEVQNLNINDKLRLDIVPIVGGCDYLPKIKVKYNGKKEWKMPRMMTEKLSKILGLLIAEGTCNRENRCDFTSGDNLIRDMFKEYIYDVFSAKDCITERGLTLSLNHSGIAKFIHALGIGNVNAYSKEIPQVIFDSTAENRRAFLSAYFEGDGTVCLEKSNDKAVIRAYTVSENLALQVQQLLLMDGILSSISTQKSRDYGTGGKHRKNNVYVISITGNFIKEYGEKIGFISHRKNKELQKCIIWTNDRKCRKIKSTYWVKINSIEENGIISMVDFMMPHLNTYLANGLLVHNSGKTSLFGMLGAYEFFEVFSKPDPAKYYGLMPGTLISCACAAASKEQGTDGIFYWIKNNLKNSDFINDNWKIDYLADTIKCLEKDTLFRLISTNTNTGVGRTNKAVFYDELDLFEENEGGRDGAWNFYNRIGKSTVSLREYGFSFATSSPITPNGIILTLYNRSFDVDNAGNPLRPKTLAYKFPTWEFNPHLTFDELKVSYIHDMDTFWKDFGCDPSATSSLQFPFGVNLDKRTPNILADLKNIPQQDLPHVMAIDPAIKSDSFGIAIGYYDGYQDRIIIDGVTSFKPERGSILSASEIRHALEGIMRRSNVSVVLFDTYMFPEMLEHFQNGLGKYTLQHIVKKEDYDRLREKMELDEVKVCYDEYLKIEMEKLEIKKLATTFKVDHPKKGSKDMADCVANVVYYISEVELVGGQKLAYFGLGGFR